jgi:acyl dehydratase
MLYALSIGLGADPMDERQLPYVYEDGLRAFPTMPVVLAWPGFWAQDPAFGIDWRLVLQGEQALEVCRPLPATGTVVSKFRITRVDDKGARVGALVYSERSLTDAGSGDLLAVLTQTTMCRGDGGFGGDPGQKRTPWQRPDRAADHECEIATPLNAGLIYRLNGDRNPLHADPAVARAGGFERPILHGLCTYGMAGHALVRSLADYDATRLRALGGRFSSPVVPGEVIRTSIWTTGDGVLFEATATGGRVVFSQGRAEITG